MPSPLEHAAALLATGRLAEAQATCEATLRQGESFDLRFALASALYRQSRFAEAAAQLERCVALEPARHDARFAWASALAEGGRKADAAREIETCLAAAPGSAELMAMLGTLREDLGEPDAALGLYERALAADPASFAAALNRGTLLLKRGRAPEALQALDALVARMPDSADAHVNRAQVLFALFRDSDALAAAETALRHQPRHLLATLARANALAALGRTAEAEEAFRLARQVDAAAFEHAIADPGYGSWKESPPDPSTIAMLRATQLQQHCDWSRRDEAIARVRALPGHVLGAILGDRHRAVAFDLLAMPFDAAEQLRIARHFASPILAPAVAPGKAHGPRPAGERVRVGFLSPDFRTHPMAWLGRPAIRDLDRARFEVFAYALNPDNGDALRPVLLAEADVAVDLTLLDDEAAAQRIADDGIDVLVECGGYCEGARPAILARRPAPVQASWLGMPGTLALEAVDYRLSDAYCTPEQEQPHWTERLVLLPDTHLAYDPPADVEAPSRDALGLPADAFVYGCLSNPLKIEPEIFGAWMRILQAVPGSVLWLFAEKDLARDHLRRAASAAGIDAGRLRFAGRLPRERFCAAAGRADLFLDTRHFGAHTTAMDVLWGGLPLLACPGETMASRLAASLLEAARLPELVAPDLDAYVATAIRLARERGTLDALRARVLASRTGAPLFDRAARVRALGDALLAMHRRRVAGLPPATLAWRAEYGAFFSVSPAA